MKNLKNFESFEIKRMGKSKMNDLIQLFEDNPELSGDKSIAGKVAIQDGWVEGYVKFLTYEEDEVFGGGDLLVYYDIDGVDEDGNVLPGEKVADIMEIMEHEVDEIYNFFVNKLKKTKEIK